ncbi:MAG: hypothetical protein WKG07_39325 [Hymenobacter sp.]
MGRFDEVEDENRQQLQRQRLAGSITRGAAAVGGSSRALALVLGLLWAVYIVRLLAPPPRGA